eukprot:Skav221729  [mRNA]  locus=scaffold542:385178:386275:+ [translate_table: standard]
MTWQCKDCGIQNSDQMDKCSQCKAHWSQVWHRSKHRNGSRNRPRSNPKKLPKDQRPAKEERKKEKDKEPTDATWAVFPTNVPWIASTPQRRIAHLRGDEPMEENNGLPPPPVLPAPPPPAAEGTPGQEATPPSQLNSEELQVLQHLKAIQKLGALPEVMKEQLQQLELKQSQASVHKSLTHGHINRLNKARHQVQMLTKRIAKVDEEWRQFMSDVTHKVVLHSQHYQTYRGDLLESLNGKIRELESVKQEVSMASQTLVDQLPHTEELAEEIDQPADLQQFQQMMETMHSQAAPTVELLDDDADEVEMEEETPHSANGKPIGRSHLAPVPFRTAGSPTKVANNTLKAKSDKSKEKTKHTQYREDR